MRNQEGSLSATEKEELFALAKAGDLRSIRESKARVALKIHPKKRPAS